MTGFSPQHRVFLAFCIYAMALGAIFPRLGGMQLQMGIAEGQLGMSVIGAALGVQLSLFITGRVFRAVGFRWTLLVGIVLISGAEMIASLSLGPLAVFCWLFVAGLAIGAVEVAVNV